MKGYNLENVEKGYFLKTSKKCIYMAIIPVLFEQVEKFHCLKLSTTQGLSTGILRLHVSMCHMPENMSQSFSTLT